MKKLKFSIYIGKNIRKEQDSEIVAFLVLPDNFPKGQVAMNGKIIENTVGFRLLHLIGDYIMDWIDLVDDESLIEAEIHINKKKECDVLRGKKIVEFIDMICQKNNYIVSPKFNNIFGGKK